MRSLHVLVSAYACYPPTTAAADSIDRQLGGGESLLGWNFVQQISRFHRVTVLTDSRNRHGIMKAQEMHPLPNVIFHFIEVRVRWHRFWHNSFVKHLYYYFWQIRALPAAWRLHRTRPFDLVHHVTYANDWIPSYIGAYLPVPFIWGPFGGGQRYPKGFQKEFSRAARLGESGRLVSQWIGRHLLAARRRCLRRARAILICNAETLSVIPARFHEKVSFFTVNGISPEDLPPAIPPRPAPRAIRILTASRLVLVKRIDFALRAFARFASACPETKAIFEIIGEGPEEGRLRRLAADLNLGGRVVFSGWMSRAGVLDRMAACDVFLFTSLREGGGFVLIEAMACARPIVCLDAAGPGFLIQEDWGLKVQPRDPEQVVEDLAVALDRLARDPGLRERLGRAGRIRVENYHIFDRLGELLQDIYTRALNARKGI